MIDFVALKENMIKEQAYSEYSANQTLEKVKKMNQITLDELEHCLKTGVHTGREVEGYTITVLKERYGLKTVAAYLTLDRLMAEPEKIKVILERGSK